MYAQEQLVKGINWKFFNFLRDTATKYEDQNYEIIIYIFVSIKGTYRDKDKIYLYKYFNSGEKYLTDFNADYSGALKANAPYIYEIHCVNNNTETTKEIHEDFLGRIKTKCTIVDEIGQGVFTVKSD